MLTATTHPHVVTDTALLDGEPVIRGTRTPVRAIVELWQLGNLTEEIPTHLPQLTLAQVFDALSYYTENREQIHRYMALNRVPDDMVHPAVRRAAGSA